MQRITIHQMYTIMFVYSLIHICKLTFKPRDHCIHKDSNETCKKRPIHRFILETEREMRVVQETRKAMMEYTEDTGYIRGYDYGRDEESDNVDDGVWEI